MVGPSRTGEGASQSAAEIRPRSDVLVLPARWSISSMSNLIVIGFHNEADAFQMRAELAKLQSQYLIEMEDAVVVIRDAKGKVQLHQSVNLTAAGAVGGAFWGMLIGLL